MHQKPSKQKLLLKQIAIYAIMTLAVLVITTFIIFFVLGFRFNSSDGRIEQYAFLQYASTPSGAKVLVDGKELGSRTPTKSAVKSGQHEVVISLDGYKDWKKTFFAEAGAITWLNYALMVPENLDIEVVAKYDAVYASLASIKGQKILMQANSGLPSYVLIDISSDTVKSKKISMPASAYSKSGTTGVKHVFDMEKWDEGGRYVLVKHTYDNATEWLVFDSQDTARTKNITKLFNINLSSIYFLGTSGNTFYALESTDIRKIDLSSETISRPLVSKVKSFYLNESNILSYIGVDTVDLSKRVAGVYRDGDSSAHVIKTFDDKTSVVFIAAARYFNEDYVVVSEGKKVDIFSGNYPNDSNTAMTELASFESDQEIKSLTFSPAGQHVVVQSGTYLASYDLEYRTLSTSTIDSKEQTINIAWLDDNYLWSDIDGKLTIREFDGTNVSVINSDYAGQDAILTHNGRFLYNFNKVSSGYQLQRSRMILK